MVLVAMQIKLTTTGRRSGLARSATLYGWEDGDDVLVVGSWAGRERDPDWAGNLRADPKASVITGKQMIEITAHELYGDARERAWALVVERFPMYATYQRKTTRQIPVFALKRR
jgi:deazaflavin-dependent oxidoreductase (nitroreductase family)